MKNLYICFFVLICVSSVKAQMRDCFETGTTKQELAEKSRLKGWDIENRQTFFVGKASQTFVGTWHDEDGYGIGIIPILIKGLEEESYTVLILDEKFNSPHAWFAQQEIDSGREEFAVKVSCLKDVPKVFRRRMRFIAEKVLKTNPPFVYKNLRL